MKKSTYMSGFVLFPTVINATGKYKTRSGEVVTITVSSDRNDHGCRGQYADGTPESWHRSGRIFSGTETVNDIVEYVGE